MKILQINSVCGYGSTGKIAVGIEEQIIKKDHTSLIAYGRGKKTDEITRYKIGNLPSFLFNILGSRLFDRHGMYSVINTNKLIKKIIEYNPDIIHLHNIHGYYLNYLILFKHLKKIDKPVVWTLHDCWSYTGHCAYYDFAKCDKWIKQCKKCPNKKAYPKSILIDNSTKNYEAKKRVFSGLKNLNIVTPSVWLADEVSKSFLKTNKITVINNGIDLNIFRFIYLNKHKNEKYHNKRIILGVASIWERRKGFEEFLKLSTLLNDDEICILIGLSKQQMDLLPDNIIGIARTDSVEELVEYYSMADVYFNLTLEDNFPTTNLESLACGTPVVTFNTGGSVESIGDCGIIVEQNDLLSALTYFRSLKYKDAELLKSQCVNRANKLYNKIDRFNDYVNLYENIISNGSANV